MNIGDYLTKARCHSMIRDGWKEVNTVPVWGKDKRMIPVAKPFLGEEEKRAVCNVIDSGMIACGAVTSEFEQKFADYVGVKHGIATSSGTTALEVSLRALGIGAGDKVLTTPFSFIASTNSIIYAGATPVFADIDPETMNLSIPTLEQTLQQQPDIKALQIVHLFGRACNMDAIMRLVQQHGLLLIEDCAQAHGATWKGRRVGSFGHAAAFSFYPTKNMTTSEGGMVLTNDDGTAEKARLLINHGMKVRYHHDSIGYNYRMTNLAASIGLCQLEKLEGFNQKRSANAAYLSTNITNPLVALPSQDEGCFHCFHQYTVRVAGGHRDAFVKHLEENGVGYGVFYPLTIPEQACYSGMGFEVMWPAADAAKQQVVSLPVHPQLDADDLRTIADVVNAFQP